MVRQEVGEKDLNVKLFVRILPGLDFSRESIKIETNSKVIHVKCLQDAGRTKKTSEQTYWSFTADDIFWNRSQEYAFRSVCDADFVEKVTEGVSGVILAYGQTGSGKTFTVSGLRHHYENRGLLLRLLSSLCDERDAKKDVKRISISMSYVEFSSTKVKDLLRNKSVEKLKDVKKVEICDEMDAWKEIFRAEVRKSANEDAPYPGSHRGHTVLTLLVESLSLIDSQPVPALAKVHVVDMSGIDSIGNAPSQWKSPSDLGYSNLTKSLMEQLILCVTGQTWGFPGCVCPYKTAKILDYLHDTLQPHCMIKFVAHVLGNDRNLPLTLSVLRFGQKVRGFKPARLERNTMENNPLITIQTLESEIDRLRAELHLKEMLSDTINYSSMSQDKFHQVRRAAKNFLLGNIEKLTLLSLGQAELTLDVFREVYENMSREKEAAIKEAVIAAIEEVQSQLGAGRPHGAIPLSTGHGKASRRRNSRQQDSRVSLTAPVRSSDSSVTGSKSSTAARVGSLDGNGISIGIGRNVSNFEGLVTRALKRVRSRKSDTALRPGPKPSSTRETGVPDDGAGVPEKVPTKAEAWKEFCAERGDVVDVRRGEISRLEEDVRVLRKNYTIALCEVGKARDALEKLRKEWEDWKHVHQVCVTEEEEESCDDGNTDKCYEEALSKKEVEVNSAVEFCHVTFIDFRDRTEALAEARASLENDFQAFCAELYDTGVMAEEPAPNETEEEASTGHVNEIDETTQMRMDIYFRFQQKMMNHVPKRKRNHWVSRF